VSYAIDILSQTIAVILISFGFFFFVVATIGLLRLPDFFCRAHAGTKCDALGAGLILSGLAIYEKLSFDSLKILLIFFIVMITTPVVGHVLARAAYWRGLVPWQKNISLFEKSEE
jgi:monovalent cation/proton antiporter MnhG/PhaG subunit